MDVEKADLVNNHLLEHFVKSVVKPAIQPFNVTIALIKPNMVAYLTVQQSTPDANWYPNTESTNHLTSEFQNFNIRSEP